ncbi:MAG: peptidoglycan-associated lipoprotein Pal [Alphaproteobacteria bacterium]
MIKKIVVAAIALSVLGACSNNSLTGSGGSGADYSTAKPGTSQDFVQNVGDRVFFALNSSSVNAQGRDTLAKQAQWLKLYPKVKITLEGHSDERGTRDYNIALGARRAQAAKNILISHGVAPSRIKTVSYGKERPIKLGETENAWSLNRRAVSVPNM